MVAPDSGDLHVSKRYFATDLEKGIVDVRDAFRTKHGLTDDNTLIFVAPGNELNETTFCAENVRKGIKEYLLKYSAPTSMSAKARPLDNFVTVISTHTGSEGERYIREHVRENNWHGKVVFVSNDENEHIDAMCASDFGIIHNGQMISSAAACHLPTMNIFNMRMHH